MDPQPMPPIEEKQIKTKYAIIVTGRMGHGKSCFTRMIVAEEIKKTIQVSSSTQSVTNQCTVYQSNLYQMAAGEQLVVIDTPGIDSKNAIYVIAEQIDNMILQQKLNIIGIAYILDIKQRDQKQQGDSYIFTFLQILRMRYTYKANLSFPILTKFDKHFQDQQDNELIFSELRETFKAKGFLKVWDRHICWMSLPQKDRPRFIKKIQKQQECEAIYKNQFLQLKQFIQNTKDTKKFLSYQQHLNNRIAFQERLMKTFQQNYHNFQLSNQIKDIQVIVEIQKQGLLRSWKNNIDFIASKCLPSFETGRFKNSPIEIISSLVIPVVTIGVLIVSPLTNWYKSTVHKRDTQLILNEQIQCKLMTLILNLANQFIKTKEQKLQFQERDFIKIDRCTNKQKQLEIKRSNDQVARIELQPGENVIKFKSRLPTNNQMQKLVEKISREYYNCQEQEKLE